ncbi:MAG: peptidylprolyl isomerase [Rickettsiaceae bacterium]|nr:peptidylprolyl isomerase [Rickettsiaceae bacterium]
MFQKIFMEIKVKKLFKTLIMSSIISMTCTSAISSSIAADTTTKSLSDDFVVAEFGKTKVTTKNVMDQLKTFATGRPDIASKKFSDFDKSAQENLVKGYVNSKIFEAEVSNSNITSSAEYKKRLDAVKVQIAQQVYIDDLLKSRISEQDLKDEYEKIKKDLTGKQEYSSSHILVATEQEAKDIKAKISKGAKFEDLAKEYSKDESSKVNGGSIGYIPQGGTVPEYENKLVNMKKDQISDPVKTAFGWHIIRFDGSRPVKVPEFNDVRQNIQEKLAMVAFEKLLQDLAKKYNVKFYL